MPTCQGMLKENFEDENESKQRYKEGSVIVLVLEN